MNSTLMEILIGANIAVLFWWFLLIICLLVDRNELLKEWKESRKHKDE